MTTSVRRPTRSRPPPTSLAAATLRVAEARVEDIGHAIARLAPDDLVRIGARPGDIVKITGRTVAVARVELVGARHGRPDPDRRHAAQQLRHWSAGAGLGGAG